MAEPAEHILAKYRPKVIPRRNGSDELFLRTEDALALCDDCQSDGLAVTSIEAFIWRDEKLYVPANWNMAYEAVVGESWSHFQDRTTGEVRSLMLRLRDRGANVFCIDATSKEEWEAEIEAAARPGKPQGDMGHSD